MKEANFLRWIILILIGILVSGCAVKEVIAKPDDRCSDSIPSTCNGYYCISGVRNASDYSHAVVILGTMIDANEKICSERGEKAVDHSCDIHDRPSGRLQILLITWCK